MEIFIINTILPLYWSVVYNAHITLRLHAEYLWRQQFYSNQ